MTRIALMSEVGALTFLEAELQRVLPDVACSTWPDNAARQAEIAVCWQPPRGALAAMPNLKLIHSIAAGVDNILSDPELPPVPLCRIVDPKLSMAMAEFVLWSTLYFHRRFDDVVRNAQSGYWHRYDQRAAADVRVGILGLGALGVAAAKLLTSVGYSVSGWSRTPKHIAGVTVLAGSNELDRFLSETDILVCLLPLTPTTTGILDAVHLGRLPKGAALVLCSRGEHLIVDDLMALLRTGHLRGAILDVFVKEPLPQDHPLWREPGILVTPHMGGLAKPRIIADQIATNVRRLQAGADLLNRIDPARGY